MTGNGIGRENMYPGREYISHNHVREIVSSAQAGSLYYDQIVGAAAYPPPWDDEAERVGYRSRGGELPDHQRAKAGFHHFTHLVADELSSRLGAASLPPDYDLSRCGGAQGLFGAFDEVGINLFAAAQPGLLPVLWYQHPRQPNYQGEQRADFLHFGAVKMPSKNDDYPISRSENLVSDLRLYLNPTVEATPEVAAILCKGFIDAHGYMPRGKFMEDVTSWRTEDRKDRLLFWVKSPNELTTLLRLTQQVQEHNAELFKDRKSMPLGEPVAIRGAELATVRVAQELLDDVSEEESVRNPRVV